MPEGDDGSDWEEGSAEADESRVTCRAFVSTLERWTSSRSMNPIPTPTSPTNTSEP